jgi:hypothetical protein
VDKSAWDALAELVKQHCALTLTCVCTLIPYTARFNNTNWALKIGEMLKRKFESLSAMR